MFYTPVALSPALPSELLSWVLIQQTPQSPPMTLIICQSREAFVASLRELRQEKEFEGDTGTPRERHTLLIPTLHQVATSREIKLVFVHTVSHLRAWFGVFPPQTKEQERAGKQFDKPGKQPPLLVLYGLVELHRDTSEWSAQGLGTSLAGVLEAGSRGKRKVVLVEARKVGLGEEGVDEGNRSVGDDRVPMLSGSVRRSRVGMEGEDSVAGWTGRTEEVGRIVGRWFKFVKGEWDAEYEEAWNTHGDKIQYV